MDTTDALIYLVRCGVNETTPDPAMLDGVDMDALCKLAASHNLGAVAACALERAGLLNEPFKQIRAKAIRKELIFDSERAAILSAFEAEGIWYMPLKGVILKALYPQVGMREMSDNDILFDADRAEDVRRIMYSLGYTAEKYDEGHRDDYQKPPVSHFEMHRVLFDESMNHPAFVDYYRDVKRLLVKDVGNGFGYHLSDEDFYVFMIAHEYKHFEWCGTGLRSLVDVYVYLRRYEATLDWEHIESAMKALDIEDFEKKNRALALKLFSDSSSKVLTAEEKAFLDLFVTSGTYGTIEHKVYYAINKSGRLAYILRRVMIPMEAVRAHYPLFYRYKVLLPLLPLYRLICKWRSAKREIKALLKNIE